MTIIIDNIITPYEIARYNEVNKVLHSNLEVWFQKKTEINSYWTYFSEIKFKYRFLDKKSFFGVISLLNKYKNNIERVVCCGWDSFVYLYTFLFCQKNKIRLTLWSGSTIFEKSWRRTLFMPLVKFIVGRADDYIAYGVRAKEYLILLGAREGKIKIFLNSVDVDYFRKEALRLRKLRLDLREKYGIQKDDTVFIYVGQLIERKGIRELIHAFTKVSSLYKNISLAIVGEGRLKEEIASFVRKHLGIKIKLLGHLQYNKLPEAYALSDVLVLPSKEEVWGLVVNEALASGVPVLVSKFAGSSVDLVEKDNGEIIEEISEKGISDILNKFLRKRKYTISSNILEKMKSEIYAKEIFAT